MSSSIPQEDEGAGQQGTFRRYSPLAAMITNRKETHVVVAPRKAAPPKVPCGEGRSRHWDKAMSLPQSMCDLCHVWAHSRDEPFLAQEMADLPELLEEGSFET
ncbi:hypothetical protein BHM03_00062347 [Ensete ventricosum]|nr:hypothetical protein BHM03_00062347 [Ensete ventricosum]